MVKLCSIFVVFFLALTALEGALGRPSELYGTGVSQTGSKWPPYPGAGLDYWALQAGFYGPQAEAIRKHDQGVVGKAAAAGPAKTFISLPSVLVPTYYRQPYYSRPLVHG